MKLITPKRTPTESAALDAAIVRALHADKPIKLIAVECDCTESYIYSLLRRRLGYEKMLISVNERWMIKQVRAGKAKFVEEKNK